MNGSLTNEIRSCSPPRVVNKVNEVERAPGHRAGGPCSVGGGNEPLRFSVSDL